MQQYFFALNFPHNTVTIEVTFVEDAANNSMECGKVLRNNSDTVNCIWEMC